MMNGTRQYQLTEAANLLLNARRTNTPIPDLPKDLQPTSIEEVAFIQDAVAAAYGEVGGYKIGAGDADATPSFAPMPRAWIAASGALLNGPTARYRYVEAEIAFLIGKDLPPRTTPYSRAEVVAAIASCHPAIEELESAFVDPKTVANFSSLADLQMHGGFFFGPAIPNWQPIDFSKESVTLAIDGVMQMERTGSNTSGDLTRLLPWLANHGGARTGGLKAGQWITTGSWVGNLPAPAHSTVDVRFAHAGPVTLRFA